MLQTLHGKEKSQLNIILDSSNNNHVAYGLVNHLMHRDEQLVLLCYHVSPTSYKAQLKGDISRISFHDGYSDPLNWESKTNVVSDVVDKLKTDESTNLVIVIDDLRLFARNCINGADSWHGLFLLLKELSSVHPVFAFVNPNVIKDSHLRSLLHICSFNMLITSIGKQLYHCESLLRKKSGKVITEISVLSFKGDELLISKKQNNKTQNVEENVEKNEVDPASNLTFNLRLTDSEREARANTVLPYILNNTSKSSYLNKLSGGGGQVIYTPDDVDDFDDEDPDDDLDI